MDWFEMRVGFHGDLKCLALRAALKNPLAECYVSRIWAQCYLQELDRVPADVGPAFLERSAEWKGKTGALVAAMLETGFLDRDGSDLVIHGVAKRLAKMRTFREKAAERKDRWEKKNAQERASVEKRERDQNGTGTHPERVPNDVQDRQDRPTDQPITDYTTGAAAPSSQAATPPAAPPATAGEEGDRSGTLGAFDLPSSRPTTVERLRGAVSAGLGIIGPGGGGLGLGDGRKVGELIRNANAAVQRIGFDAVVEALVSDGQQAKAKGRAPETLTFFTRTLQGLANPEAVTERPRVTAPASPRSKFEKGGPVAL